MSIKEQIIEKIKQLDNEASELDLDKDSFSLEEVKEQIECLGEIRGLRWVLSRL